MILKFVDLFLGIGKPYKVTIVDDVDRFWGHKEVSAEISRLTLNEIGYAIIN